MQNKQNTDPIRKMTLTNIKINQSIIINQNKASKQTNNKGLSPQVRTNTHTHS